MMNRTKDRSESVDIESACIKSCNILFEIFCLNFKLLRSTQEFETLWFSFMSILAQNFSCLSEFSLSNQSTFQLELTEMTVALLRYLVPETTTSSKTDKIPIFLINAKNNGSIYDGTQSNVKEDIVLLNLTWKAMIGVCSNVGSYINQTHPYMVEILNRDLSQYIYADEVETTSRKSAPVQVQEYNENTVNLERVTEIIPDINPKVHEQDLKINNSSSGDVPEYLYRSIPVPPIKDPNDNGRMRKINARTHVV
jgi:hypothetical protein